MRGESVSVLSRSFTRVGDIADSIAAGITLGAHRAPLNRTAPYLRVANVRKGRVELSDLQHVELQRGDRPRYEVRAGDVLVVEGHANPDQIGRCALAGERESGLLYQNHLFRLRFSKAVPRFVELWLNSAKIRSFWRSRCTTSSGLYTVNSKMLQAVPFPIVSMEEQNRIADAVMGFDFEIRALDQRIEKLSALRDAVIEDLLSRVDVEYRALSALGSIRLGKKLSPSSVGNGEQFPYLRVANVLAGRIDMGDLKTMHFAEHERAVFRLRAGDVLLNEGQSLELVGRSSVFRGSSQPLYFQNTLIRFRPAGILLPDYGQIIFSRWLRDGEFSKLAKQTTSIAHLSTDRFSRMDFPLISLADQETVIKTAVRFSSQLTALETRAAKLRTMRQALAEDVLAGRVRVTDL